MACRRSPIFILLAHTFCTACSRSPLFILLTRIFCHFGTMKATTKAIKHAIPLEMPSALMKGASQHKTSFQECFCRDGESLSTTQRPSARFACFRTLRCASGLPIPASALLQTGFVIGSLPFIRVSRSFKRNKVLFTTRQSIHTRIC